MAQRGRDRPNSSSRRRRLVRRWALLAGLGLLAVVFGAWSLRDVPRRQLERALERRVGGPVQLGAIELHSTDRVVLRDVELRAPGVWAGVDRVTVARVEASGDPLSMADGRFARLVLRSAEVVLRSVEQPSSRGVPSGSDEPGSGQAPQVVADELVLDEVTFRFRARNSGTRLRMRGRLLGWGEFPRGRLEVDGRELELGELAAAVGVSLPSGLRGGAEVLTGQVLVEDGGVRWLVDGRAERVRAAWEGRSASLAEATVRGEIRDGPAGASRRVSLVAELGRLGEWHAELSWSSDASRPAAAVIGRGWDPAMVAGLVPERLGWERAEQTRWVARMGANGELSASLRGRVVGARWTTDAGPLSPGPLRVRAAVRGGGEGAYGTFGSLAGELIAEGPHAPPLRCEGSWRREPGGDRVRVEGVAGPAAVERWLELAGPLDHGERFADELRRMGAGGRLQLRGRLEGAWPEGRWTGEAELSDVRLGRPGEDGWSLSGGRGQVVASGSLGGGPVAVRASLAGEGRIPRLEGRALRAEATGLLDPARPSLRMERAEVTAGELGSLALQGRWTPSRWELTARHDGLAIGAWWSWLDPLLPLPAEWERPSGTVVARATLASGREGSAELEAELDLQEGSWSSQDGTRAFQGLGGSWSFTGTLGVDQGAVRGEGSVTGPLLLWRSTFADLGRLSASGRAELSWAAVAGAASWQSQLGFELPAGTRVELEASRSRQDGASAALRLRAERLGAAYEALVVEPLGSEGGAPLPRARGGALELNTRWRRPVDGPERLSGRLTLEGADVSGAQGEWRVRGLEADLPFSLVRGGSSGWRGGGPERKGELSFDSGAVRGVRLPGVRSPVRVRGTRFAVSEPVELAVAGGKALLRGLEVEPGLGRPAAARAEVELDGLELARLTEAAGLPRLEGRITGRFPGLTLEGSRVRVDGGGRIDVFGGTVRIEDIAGEEVLSAYPRLRFSAKLEDIDLASVTRTFAFGEMTGLVEGYVRDCVLVGGVPVEFEAELRTVERSGVPRTIGVKAINNLAILGTGGEVSVLDRGLHRFLDRYTYDRLGIRAVLEDDRFLLRGLEHEGDEELFLEGRFPLPIDIVNARPGQTIGFRSMLERLRRIDFSAATTGEGGLD